MVEKYLGTREASIGLCEFLEPMLRVDHRERKQARELVEHEWLEVEGEVEGEGVSWV